MTFSIKDMTVNYIQYGSENEKNIVLLHGWGQNIEMMKPLGDKLTDYHITIMDMPGFGESSEPHQSLTIYDYVEVLEELLQFLNIKKPIIIGHSFGGRVAIVFSSQNNVEKVVLFGSPCVRHERKSLKESLLKKAKKIPGMNKLGEYAKKYIGSTDYKNASTIMRETLVNVINEDLSSYARKIKCPTLLIWGTLDTAAPIEEARELEALLVDGGLVALPGYTHYAYLEALPQVINILRNFL
ncbi:MAG: alpha/beta hydrolase [bacterium]|nr:alpha/beta hydrolase [bacterium]